MNKLLRKIAVASVGFAMAIGIGVAVGSNGMSRASASEESYVITFKGSSTTSDSTAKTAKDDIILSGGDYISSVSATRIYQAATDAQQTNNGIKGGASSNKGTLVLNWNASDYPVKPTRIVANIAIYNAADDLSHGVVWGYNSNTNNAAKSGGATYTDYPLTLDGNTDLTSITIAGLQASKSRFYVRTVTVYYEAGGGQTTPLDAPTSLDYDENQNRVTWTLPDSTNTEHCEISFDDGANWSTTTAKTYHSTSTLDSSASYSIKVKACPSQSDTSHTNSSATSYVFAILDHEGTDADPYTVSDAKAFIDTLGDGTAANKYVSGIISQVDSYNSKYSSITYWISDDGTTSNQLEAYSGLGLNSEGFSAVTDLKVNDVVTICGTLKKHNSTYEFDYNNYLVSHSTKTLTSISLSGSMTKYEYTTSDSWDPTGITVTAHYSDSSSATIDNSDVTWTYYNSSDVEKPTPSAFGVTDSAQTLKIVATYDEQSANTTKQVTVSSPSYQNTTSSLVAGTYYIKYDTHYFTGSISSGKGAQSTTKPETNDAKFVFSLVADDVWSIISLSENRLGVTSNSSTALGYGNSYTFEITDGANGTYNIRSLQQTTRYIAYATGTSDFRSYTGTYPIDITLEDVSAVLYTITYDANDGSGDPMSDTVGAHPVVASCTFTAPEGKMFSHWNTAADDSGESYKPGDVAESDLDLFAIWVKEVGNNVTMTPGENSGNATLTVGTTDKDAVKCGTGSKQGDMTLTLKNAGITKIKVYVAGWSSDTTNKTVNVSIDNSATITPSSLTLSQDSGISGSGSSFTLSGDEADYKFEFTISGAPAGTKITLQAATSSNNRFVVWGATDMFAESFATIFNSNTTCDSDGDDAPSFVGDYDWSTYALLFDSLDEEEQGYLHDAQYTKSGSGSSTVVDPASGVSQNLADAVARYDYIVGKYNPTLSSTSAYNDFMGRSPSPVGSGRINIPGVTDGNSGTVAVVIISLVSVTAVGGYFLLRKKKED